jgi:hypothetical protein
MSPNDSRHVCLRASPTKLRDLGRIEDVVADPMLRHLVWADQGEGWAQRKQRSAMGHFGKLTPQIARCRPGSIDNESVRAASLPAVTDRAPGARDSRQPIQPDA